MLWILQPTVDLRRKLIQAYSHVNPRNGVTWSRHFYLWQILDDTDQKLHITKIIHEIDPHGKLKFDSQSDKEGTNDGCAYQKFCWRRDPLILIFLYHSLVNSFFFLIIQLYLPCMWMSVTMWMMRWEMHERRKRRRWRGQGCFDHCSSVDLYQLVSTYMRFVSSITLHSSWISSLKKKDRLNTYSDAVSLLTISNIQW